MRTLGEAQARCKAVTDAVAGAAPAAWEIAGASPGDAVEKLDHYPYSHRVRDVMNASPALVAAAAPLEPR